MSIYYFAYGSNMLSERMVARIPEAKIAGLARLYGWELVWDKISTDGSAKANLKQENGKIVWGAVYLIPESRMPDLDKVEGGYQRIEVEVERDKNSQIAACTYVSEKRDANLLPYDWYKELVLRGAKEHSLPSAYIDEIARVKSKPDTRKSAGETP
jgi:gamma-glutamylcyclotransferase (GGCT)/AIG2-like uncharacterized protein YtfP